MLRRHGFSGEEDTSWSVLALVAVVDPYISDSGEVSFYPGKKMRRLTPHFYLAVPRLTKWLRYSCA
jgi:hypothetical protein